MSLERCSNFTINGGAFTAITGLVHNLVMERPDIEEEEEGPKVLAQYQELKAGQIYLKRKITVSTVWECDTAGWRRLDAQRTFHIATIGDREREFLYVSYSGPDALQVYRKDIETFATVKDINYAQLFGYINWSASPALVFYDALVPVSRVFEQNGFPCILEFYLCYSAITQGLDARTMFCELWTDPRNGMLHTGPYVADSSNLNYLVGSWPNLVPPSSDHHFLDLQAYTKTSTLFEYLIGILPIHNVVEGIRGSNKGTSEWPSNQDTKFLLSSLPGTIYHRTSREVIARYLGDREKWFYRPWEEHLEVPDPVRENTFMMDDGSVKFMLNPVDIAGLESLWLYYTLRPVSPLNSLADSWMSQANAIFSQLGIVENEWGEYSTLDNVWLYFELEENEEASHTDIPTLATPIYLFIPPIPRPSDNEEKWDAWLEGRKYYWSFDLSGKDKIPEDEWLRLGLPLFKSSIIVLHRWWDSDVYDAIQMVNRHQGCNPVSMELAVSLKHSILEVAGRNTRFEEVQGDDEVLANGAGAGSPLPFEIRSTFEDRIRWIRAYRSLFSGHSGTSSNDQCPLPNMLDVLDVD